MKIRVYQRKKMLVTLLLIIFLFIILLFRMWYIMVNRSEYYKERADDLHERERVIKAERGIIYDRNGVALATNKSVCTISVIHNQIKEPEKVIQTLSKVLDMDAETVRKRVDKVSSIERIRSNVPKETGDLIRSYKLDGVMVDEDYARYYPYDSLGAKILGFTGGDNQGIIGLEVKYDDYLQGEEGKILTTTDVRGIEVKNSAETRIDPIMGESLHISLDYNIQAYVTQIAEKVMLQKQAKSVSVILMNPQNGELYAMVNVPEFDLNEPFTLNTESDDAVNTQDLLNQMWRNGCINDTYEPGSTFKIITATAALEKKVVGLNDTFSCPGFRVVADRRIRCHKSGGHGSETFTQGFMNSCNPVFMDVGARVGIEGMYEYFRKLGLFEKTGVDLPGEAGSIMHKIENVGAVELATISFGQSFQITPLQLLRAVSAVINGGNLVTPHFGMYTTDVRGNKQTVFEYPVKSGAILPETSETMKKLLGLVVSEGTGKNGQVTGYQVGGKTATSQKLPRGSGKYIASFIGFSPVENPQIIGIILIDEPVGTYYGGTIAAPVMSEIFEMVLPYLFPEEKEIPEDTEEGKLS
ncbi:peptidoglycan D,D-transpeptidase FtsI family protein [Frisingicoccus sp.]|uniref:peptidoglycan D,D-transpeptidase FtsI family protein n=1 Tax=Frisingicoccus sp. TaxID=1918627 RepID=UPI002A811646|nr:penicillin-binding transpeptidase domain-containing protein [Frisingicoccus sp.]MDY4834756.1 penicillin-binding transpeptidase domain-containing protein [Frisingicoccus sp.]MDY4922723.1 penicillin-binding transpeptidase domain-containing protein [Frisingicoccus sp.]